MSRPARDNGPAMACPVCRAAPAAWLLSVDARSYWFCPVCEARFLDPAQHPSPEDELAHYRQHQNHPDDPGYRRFLSKLATPLSARLQRGAAGLDYGCGPGPALAAMLSEAGHEIALYDPFFQPDRSVLAGEYDFVTCTETAEHFHDPAAEFARLMALVRPGGWLAIMTCFQTDDARFARWHYRMDPTHVVFYRARTLQFLARRAGWTCEIPAKDVALMRRPLTRADHA